MCRELYRTRRQRRRKSAKIHPFLFEIINTIVSLVNLSFTLQKHDSGIYFAKHLYGATGKWMSSILRTEYFIFICRFCGTVVNNTCFETSGKVTDERARLWYTHLTRKSNRFLKIILRLLRILYCILSGRIIS